MIEEALKRAQKVDAIDNGPFQRFLQETIEREDLIEWANREDYTASITMSLPERKRHYKFMSVIP